MTVDMAVENTIDYTLSVMTMEDYDEVYHLWMQIHGFGIRTMDDSREGIERFIRRNPTTSVVARCQGKVIGAILCGHDGRRGCLYHVCGRAVPQARNWKSDGRVVHEGIAGGTD